MATIFMVRHASHALLDRVLTGRHIDIGLDEKGWREAEALSQTLVPQSITHIHSSPRRRARQTACAVGRRLGLSIEIVPALDEVDFGHWAGRAFTDLKADPLWVRWNSDRSGVRAPAGECILEVLSRVTDHLSMVSEFYPGARVVMVTHAEVIRALVLSRAGLPLGAWRAVDVPPASIRRICVHAQDGRLSELYEDADVT
ncbi:MAG: histidine phosphatase family protein [Hyphomicrobium sp.]|nr:histidine phosphatase family protein [Hyphomicrobium sp.]